MVLALLSGALASGLGYVLWYRALTGLSKVTAAVAGLLILGGIGLVLLARPRAGSTMTAS